MLWKVVGGEGKMKFAVSFYFIFFQIILGRKRKDNLKLTFFSCLEEKLIWNLFNLIKNGCLGIGRFLKITNFFGNKTSPLQLNREPHWFWSWESHGMLFLRSISIQWLIGVFSEIFLFDFVKNLSKSDRRTLWENRLEKFRVHNAKQPPEQLSRCWNHGMMCY